MIKKFLLDILIDPVTKRRLDYNQIKNNLSLDAIEKYEIVDDVPVVLIKQDILNESALHKKLNSTFNYFEHYEKDAEYFNYFEEESKITLNERIRSREAIINKVSKNALTILDTGCGNGWVAEYFTKKNKQVISMDISKKNPIQALKLYSNKNHAALVADVFNMPIKENSIDILKTSEIIEHLHNPKIFIERLLTVLKPGGKIIIITPYNEKIIKHICVHCNLPTPANAHLHSFNEKNIKELLPLNGFEFNTIKFNNKYFTKLRLYYLLKFLPFKIWNILDKIINLILNGTSLFLVEIVKIEDQYIK